VLENTLGKCGHRADHLLYCDQVALKTRPCPLLPSHVTIETCELSGLGSLFRAGGSKLPNDLREHPIEGLPRKVDTQEFSFCH
jgi:hypothetical protein